MTASRIEFLQRLEQIVAERILTAPAGSYTAELAAAGTRRMAQKVGEEACEVVLAAAAGDRDELLDESADLLYHLIVLLNCQGIKLADIAAKLEQRHN